MQNISAQMFANENRGVIVAFAFLMCFTNVPGQAEFLTKAFPTGGTMKAVNFSMYCLLMPV